MPRSGRPVITKRRRAWSLIRARKFGSLIAPADLPPSAALTVVAVARGTSPSEDLEALFLVSGPAPSGRALASRYGGAPLGAGSAGPQRGLMPFARIVDLLGRQLSALGRGECRHQRAGPSFRDDAPQLRVRYQGQEQLVVQRRCRAQLAVRSMATDAVPLEQDVERPFLLGRDVPVTGLGLTGEVAAGRPAGEQGQQRPVTSASWTGTAHRDARRIHG